MVVKLNITIRSPMFDVRVTARVRPCDRELTHSSDTYKE